MKELLEAGVHFGHQTKRWNPKMKKYIFGKRNGIYIIDLQKTLKLFKEASGFIADLAGQGKRILFVGTKRQAQDTILEEANRCGMFYVNNRWLGGTLCFSTVGSRSSGSGIESVLNDAEEECRRRSAPPDRERESCRRTHRNPRDGPSGCALRDRSEEGTSVQEAKKLKIPVVAIVTPTATGGHQPRHPGNDDAIRANPSVHAEDRRRVPRGYNSPRSATSEPRTRATRRCALRPGRCGSAARGRAAQPPLPRSDLVSSHFHAGRVATRLTPTISRGFDLQRG
jgi:ribosomal protein S2